MQTLIVHSKYKYCSNIHVHDKTVIFYYIFGTVYFIQFCIIILGSAIFEHLITFPYRKQLLHTLCIYLELLFLC